jgi:hypothetical protein
MIARIAGTVILSTVVFVVVSLLVSLGMLWWTSGARGVVIGVICGFLAASIVAMVSTAVGRSRKRPRDRHRDENDRSSGGPDR